MYIIVVNLKKKNILNDFEYPNFYVFELYMVPISSDNRGSTVMLIGCPD